MVLNPESAMRPQTQSVDLGSNLYLTIEPLDGGNVSKVSFSQGAPAEPVPVPEGYQLVYKNSQEPVGKFEEAWYKPFSADCTLMKDGEKVLEIYDPKEMSVWVLEEEV